MHQYHHRLWWRLLRASMCRHAVSDNVFPISKQTGKIRTKPKLTLDAPLGNTAINSHAQGFPPETAAEIYRRSFFGVRSPRVALPFVVGPPRAPERPTRVWDVVTSSE